MGVLVPEGVGVVVNVLVAVGVGVGVAVGVLVAVAVAVLVAEGAVVEGLGFFGFGSSERFRWITTLSPVLIAPMPTLSPASLTTVPPVTFDRDVAEAGADSNCRATFGHNTAG